MKKMKAFAALALTSAVLLSACGSSGAPASTASTAEESAASSVAEAAEATESADSSAAATESAAPTEAAEAEAEEEADYVPVEGTLAIVATSEDYQTLFDMFSEDTGVKTELLSMSSGEVLTKLRAEGGTPMADLWFGGGIDAFMSAKDDGLLRQVELDAADEIAEDFKDPDGYWYTKGLTVVGFIVNNDIVDTEGLTVPNTWEALTDEQYQGEIIMSNPAISGTNYGVVNAMLQKLGEEDGWAYFEALDKNIEYYSKRGGDPREKTAAGEFAIGITPLDNKTNTLAEEQNCTIIYPEDGIPYVPEGVAVFANSTNGDAAVEFLNWLYSSDDHLKKLAEIDGKDTVKAVKPNIEGLELTFDTSTLMKEDLSLFGSERDAILEKWDALAGAKSEE